MECKIMLQFTTSIRSTNYIVALFPAASINVEGTTFPFCPYSNGGGSHSRSPEQRSGFLLVNYIKLLEEMNPV